MARARGVSKGGKGSPPGYRGLFWDFWSKKQRGIEVLRGQKALFWGLLGPFWPIFCSLSALYRYIVLFLAVFGDVLFTFFMVYKETLNVTLVCFIVT